MIVTFIVSKVGNSLWLEGLCGINNPIIEAIMCEYGITIFVLMVSLQAPSGWELGLLKIHGR